MDGEIGASTILRNALARYGKNPTPAIATKTSYTETIVPPLHFLPSFSLNQHTLGELNSPFRRTPQPQGYALMPISAGGYALVVLRLLWRK